jgi:mono/diheme cytochrome c family protein
MFNVSVVQNNTWFQLLKPQEEEHPMVKRAIVAAAFITAGVFSPLSAQAAFDAPGYFQLRCSGCHGTEGQGTKGVMPALGPALKGNPFVVNGSPAAVKTVIRKGRSGQKRLYNDTYPNMPSFGAEAIPDVDALVAYLKGDLQK